MDFKKIFDQAVREIKREVNLKVLNVPEIEQQVLDATSNEPWGPHGSDLKEIAGATEVPFECDLVMSVLWQRLSNTKANWRHLYKALVVIEYLVANGSQHAVSDIYDNISLITALSTFECVEPNGKDVGLSVRKKSDAILIILDDREKLQEVREKAAATRDKYVALSSTSFKPNIARSFSSKDSESTNGYGVKNRLKDTDRFISNKKTESYDSSERDQRPKEKARQKSQRSMLKDDCDDDFNPRAAATHASDDKSSNSVDLFVPNLMDDIIDVPTSSPNSKTTTNHVQNEVDLFADATFQSSKSNSETISVQNNIDLFANISSEAKTNSSISGNKSGNNFDPFAGIPLNKPDTWNRKPEKTTTEDEFEFGAFVKSDEGPEKLKFKDGNIQVKSGIWADSLSRGLIDLDITACKFLTSTKKSSLADKKDSILRQSQSAKLK